MDKFSDEELSLTLVSKRGPRPAFSTIYMNLAVGLSARSTCRRLAVGCAIVSPDWRYVYGVGYNGNAAGLANDCDSDEVGKCGCIHAETNAVVNCSTPRSFEKVVLVTHLPCVACAKLLINLGGVQKVYYLNDYRIRDSVAILEKVGIYVVQFDPEKCV